MTENQNQPPTREQIAEALYLDDADHEDWSWATEGNPLTRAAYLKNADAVLALFQQQTPSIKPNEWADQQRQWAEAAMRSPQAAEPVSIADIEQGVLDQISASRSAPLAPALQPNPGWNKRGDVTPPPATPEGDR